VSGVCLRKRTPEKTPTPSAKGIRLPQTIQHSESTTRTETNLCANSSAFLTPIDGYRHRSLACRFVAVCRGALRRSRSQRLHGLASGAAGVCMIRPTTSPAGRAAVLLNYVLRPAGFIGHCNVRSSLNVAGKFRTSKKTPPMLRSPEDLNLLLKVAGQPGSPTKSKA
jgi:hypothetical protein